MRRENYPSSISGDIAGGYTGTSRDRALVVWSAVSWTAHRDRCLSVRTSRGPIRWHSCAASTTRTYITFTNALIILDACVVTAPCRVALCVICCQSCLLSFQSRSSVSLCWLSKKTEYITSSSRLCQNSLHHRYFAVS